MGMRGRQGWRGHSDQNAHIHPWLYNNDSRFSGIAEAIVCTRTGRHTQKVPSTDKRYYAEMGVKQQHHHHHHWICYRIAGRSGYNDRFNWNEWSPRPTTAVLQPSARNSPDQIVRPNARAGISVFMGNCLRASFIRFLIVMAFVWVNECFMAQ